MARTYGEIVEASFPTVFALLPVQDTVFVDIGSGHGTITIDAVRSFGCRCAIGIEKYRYIFAVVRLPLAAPLI